VILETAGSAIKNVLQIESFKETNKCMKKYF